MQLKDYLVQQKNKRSCDIDDLAKRVEELEKINETSNDEEELKAAGEELDALKAKKEELQKELDDVNAQIEALDKPADEQPADEQPKDGQRKFNPNNMTKRGQQTMNKEELEKRAKEFVATGKMTIQNDEVRSTLLASGGIAKPTKVDGINDPFPTANSVVDQVYVDDATGCGNYKISFQKTLQEATAKTDGVAQSGSDPTFGMVEIKPYLVSTTSYVSKELKKQTPLNYQEKVKQSALKALRVKVANLIFNGAGANFYGIKNAVDTEETPNPMVATYPVIAANAAKPVADAKFLRNLVLSYGGDDNAYGDVGVLYLNKKDLLALGDIRGANEKKAVYEIIPDANPNTGVIKDGGLTVRYCISSQLTSLFDTAAATGTTKQTMIYGVPTNYNLSLFGNYEIEESKDYKFAEGLITILGEVMVGGNVQVWKGFTVVTLATA